MATDVTTTGTAAPLDPSQSTLSVNFAPYVYDMLAKGQATANLDYLPYTGQRYAGPSALETQAFSGLGALGQFNPAQFSSGYTAPSLSQATQFSNQFNAPGAYNPAQFSSGYTAPSLSQATQFSNQFNAPGAYNAAQFNTGLGAVGSVQDYMSPYLSNVMDIEAREARRQADISRQTEQARLAQAGAFGGSRQAIMEAERQRNLGTQIGDITSRGLQSAYDRALEQRLKESGLGLEAQRGTEASRQFGAQQSMTAAQLAAQYGMSAQQAQEAARQFQEQQRARGAEFGATQGLEAQRLGETSRQFGAQQGLTAAQSAAQYGLAGLQQTEAARQFQEQERARGAEFGSTQGLEAQRLGEASRQFGANYGLSALRDMMSAGERQRAIAQAPLDFRYQQYQEQMKYPYQQTAFMQSLLEGLPLEAPRYQPEQSALLAALQGGLGTLALLGR
jgi:hypothetical protein